MNNLNTKTNHGESKEGLGHLLALFTIIVWGATFISSKILLDAFSPLEILFFRFFLGTIALSLVSPRKLSIKNTRHNIYFIIAGISGVTLYFLFENIALTYTLASNVGIIVSVSPFFTALLSKILLPSEKLKKTFFIGFLFAIIGIAIISLNGKLKLEINPLGDLLGLFAAFVWSIYSIMVKKISDLKYNMIKSTRRIFFIGLIFMIPFAFFMKFNLDLSRFHNPIYLGNILFLGLGASATCFVTWSLSVKYIGAIKTSVYIYAIPVVTVILATLFLKEDISIHSIVGMILIIIGLVLSESNISVKSKNKK